MNILKANNQKTKKTLQKSSSVYSVTYNEPPAELWSEESWPTNCWKGLKVESIFKTQMNFYRYCTNKLQTSKIMLISKLQSCPSE